MEQTQSSAPRFRPPNTLCNTDGWRRTRKSTGKITVRSAQRTGEAKKRKHGTQNQSLLGVTFRSRGPPALLTQATAGTRRSRLLPGLSRLLAHLTLPTGLKVSGSPEACDPLTFQGSRWGQHRGAGLRRSGETRVAVLTGKNGACDVLAVLKSCLKINSRLVELKVQTSTYVSSSPVVIQ